MRSLLITGCLVVLFIILSTLILLSDRFINQQSIINRIQTEVSQAIGGQVEFQRLELSIFPQPHLSINRCSFSIPATARGTLTSLAIYPKMLPLFTGKLQVAGIDLNAPDIEIQPGKRQEATPKNLQTFSFRVFQEKVTSALKVLSLKAPGLILTVAKGRLKLVEDNKTISLQLNLNVKFATDGLNVWQAEFRGSLPSLTMHQKEQELAVRAERFKGNIYYSKDNLTVVLDELNLDYPRLNLSGKFNVRPISPASFRPVGLELKAVNVDVHSARRVALSLAGDIPVVQAVFKIVKGGKLPDFNFTAQGDSIEDLGKLGNIVIKSSMRNGEIFVPKVDLDLTKVKGEVSVVKGILQGSHLEARLGNSRGFAGTLKLGLAGANAPFHLDLDIEADLTQLSPILKRVIDNDAFLQELAFAEKLKGNATGKLLLGEHLASIETNVEVSQFNLFANYRRLPYPLKLNGGKFSYKNGQIALSNLNGRMGKSTFSGLSVGLNLKEASYLEIKAGQSNLLMEELCPWLFSCAAIKDKLPRIEAVNGFFSLSAFSFRPPISISAAHLIWNKRRETALSVDLTLPQGLKLSADILVQPDQLTIKKLVIQDSESQASVKLTSANRAIDLAFSGNLNKSTLDRLVAQNQVLGGWIKGDFHTHVLLDQPAGSTVQGRLGVKDLVLPWKQTMLLTINTLSLEAEGDNLHVEAANLSLADNHFDLKGNVRFDPKGFLLDMEVGADALDLDTLKQSLDQNIKKNHDQDGQSMWDYPVQGALKLRTEKLTWAGYTWSPFNADISFSDKSATVSVIEASLCGIGTPGVLKLAPQKISLEVKPAARSQKLDSAIYCLIDKSVKVDGNFNLQGSVAAMGTAAALPGSLNGNLVFDATAGRFYSGIFHSTLMDIFGLPSVTEVFRGKLPDISKEGFGYNSIRAKADIQHGQLTLNEMIIDGISMNIVGQGSIDLANKQVDCVALVAPFKAIDFFVEKIPVVKDILGGSLISIPVGIKGDLENPSVTPLAPSAVGSELLGFMKRILQLPVLIIQPFMPP